MIADISPIRANVRKGLIFFLTMHFIAWTLVPIILQQNGSLDVMEALSWGAQWQLGYDRDPFLVAWLAHIFSVLGGRGVWPVYVLSQVCIVSTFWAVWRIGEKLSLPPLYALMAVLLLEGIVYFNFTTPEFNDNVLQMPLWAFAILFYYDALKHQRVKDWALTGLFLGLSMMAKYFTVMLIAPMLVFLFITKQSLQSFKKPGLYCALLVFLLVVSPNLYWLMKHNFAYVTYALNRASTAPHVNNHFWYPFRFLLEQIGPVFPAFVVFLTVCFSGFFEIRREKVDDAFLLFVGLGPLVTVVLYSAVTGSLMRSMWGAPLFSLLGVILFRFLNPIINHRNLRYFIYAALGFFATSIVVYAFSILAVPYWLGYGKTAIFPGKPMAVSLTKEWRQRFHRKLEYVAGPRRLAARVYVYSPDHPTVYFNWSHTSSPWVNERAMRKAGALFVWNVEKSGAQLPADIAKRFPRAKTLPVHEYQWLTGARITPARVGVAFLPPQG